MTINSDIRAINEAFIEAMTTPGLEKRAELGAIDFLRRTVREDGIYRRVIPAEQVSNSDLTRRVDSPLPSIVVDMEPGQPAAATVSFRSMPSTWWIGAPRFEVTFARIQTPRFTADLDELRTWHMDIRQVISDNAAKDILYEEDSGFFNTVNNLIGPAGSTVPTSGIIQWDTILGGITRDSLEEAFKIIPRTPSHLEVQTVVCNNVTIRDVLKAGRDEVGGDLSERLFVDGWTLKRFMNADWYITIKRDLVPDSSIYMFGDPRFVGKFYVLEDVTMHIEREAYIIRYFSYELIGGAIPGIDGLARVDFA